MKPNLSRSIALPALIIALLLGGRLAHSESVEQKAEATIIPDFHFDLTTPAQALKSVASQTGLKVFYTPRPKDWPTFSVALKNIPASEALEFIAMTAHLKLTYAEDGAHLQATDPPPREFATLRDADGVRFYQERALKQRHSFVVKAGDLAPDFSCRLLSGEDFSLRQEKGKVVLIDFFATWCGPCLAEMPRLEKEIFQKYKDRKDFQFLAIGQRHEAGQLETFRKEKNFSLPMAPDEKGVIFNSYATDYIPKLYLIGRDGKIKLAVSGFTEQTMQDVIQALQKELGAS